MNTKFLITAVVIFVGIGLYSSLKKGILFEKAYPLDLSNRVVGARLQKDGLDPYFYKWKPEHGTRYYDYINFDTFAVSRCTASPFFHQLMYPIVELPQRKISQLWLTLHYVLLTFMVFIACKMTGSFKRRLLIVVVAAGFLFTEGWNDLMAAGQLYLVIAFVALLFYYFISTAKSSLVKYAIAGLLGAALVLIRPTTIFFFLPLLFLLKQYAFKQKLIFFISFAILPLCIFLRADQRYLWTQYQHGIQENIRIHQHLNPIVKKVIPDPKFENWEGWNRAAKDSAWWKSFPMRHSENGNVFFIVEHIIKKRISVELLMIGFFSAFFVLMIVFFASRRSVYLYNATLFGWCIFMLSDFLSPVIRYQYYSVQWFFPLFLVALHGSPRQKLLNMLLFLALILNIIDTTYIKMEHTTGEFLWMGCLLYISFTYRPTQKNMNHQQNKLNHA